jgi:hypothetical protein
MFEDFRKLIDDSGFNDEDQKEVTPEEDPFGEPRRLLGLTAVQRFFVAFMLLMMTIILGVLFLLVTSKIAFPFLG